MENKFSGVFLTSWFERLVKNGMAAVAVVLFGIFISCFLLTFSKLFEGVEHYVVFGTGAVLLPSFGILLYYVAWRQVDISLHASSLAKDRRVTAQPTEDKRTKKPLDEREASCPAEGGIAHPNEGASASPLAATKRRLARKSPRFPAA